MSRWTDNSPNGAKPHRRASEPGSGSYAARNSAGNRGRTQDPRSVSRDDLYTARQRAGLAALIGVAQQVSGAVPVAPARAMGYPTLPDVFPSRLNSYDGPPLLGPEDYRKRKASRNAARRSSGLKLPNLRANHLVRNTLALVLNAGMQAGLGFAFWIIMARLYSKTDVGIASSLIAVTGFIAFSALFGFNSTLIRFLPTARDKNSLITAATILVAVLGSIIGLAYVLLTPVFAPRLAFVAHSPRLVVGFVLLAGATAVNLLADSVFIGSRQSVFCALTDGVVGGISKIVFGVILAGTGAYGLYSASTGGQAAAAVASIVLMITFLRWRPSLKRPLYVLKPLLRFSGANYAANAVNILPTVVVPLIVLDRLGAQTAAYYFVAFQMATLLYAAVYSVESAFLAEGSQARADLRAVGKRSLRLVVMLFLPGGLVLALGARWALLAFGSSYSQHGTASLEFFALAVIPIAACNWSWTVLRLSGKLGALVVGNVVYSAAVCGLAWFLADHGLTTLAAAWPIGCAVAAVVSASLAASALRKPSERSLSHRRAAQSPLSPVQSYGRDFQRRNGVPRYGR
jgi:O-antigen/teichoic acid export membrane protein